MYTPRFHIHRALSKISKFKFLHLFVALLQKAHFPKGIKQKLFPYNRLLLSYQDKGCTPSVAHSLALPLGPGLYHVSNIKNNINKIKIFYDPHKHSKPLHVLLSYTFTRGIL